jgi:hypothetical protein
MGCIVPKLGRLTLKGGALSLTALAGWGSIP